MTAATKPRLLVRVPLADDTLAALVHSFVLLVRTEPEDALALTDEEAASIVAMLTNGTTGCSPALLERLPALRVVSAFGAGYEGVAVQAALARGVQVTHAPGTNSATVADHAIALALAVARDLCARNAAVHAGDWAHARAACPTLNGATVGIIGMGRIGRMIADRAAAFGAAIAYYTPRPNPSAPGMPYPDVVALATASDFLIAACPGGPATFHLVDAAVLEALGPQGFFVNVSRGSVADTTSLVQALHACRIAGAAIDVFEGEPNAPAELLAAPNLLITPHMAGRSPASVRAQTELLARNLQFAMAGQRCPNHVPV